MLCHGACVVSYAFLLGLWNTVQGYNHELCIPKSATDCDAAPFPPGNVSSVYTHPDLIGLGKVKILPLGDSLTKGQVFMKCDARQSGQAAVRTDQLCDGSTSYRYFLGLHLQVCQVQSNATPN